MAARSVCAKAALLRFPKRPSIPHDVFRLQSTPLYPKTMATESEPQNFKVIPPLTEETLSFPARKSPTVLATIYNFPTMEPVRFESYFSKFLHAPLRRDILHKAVIFEGDAHRLGRANTKTRAEVHGSSKKIRPQKGTGRARLGDKKSPMLRGGGVAHGPKPRDFSSGLPRKMYDMAWRTALSYRYRRNELIVVDGVLELQEPDAGLISTIINNYGWGHDNQRSLLITNESRPNLEEAMSDLGADARLLTKEEVDVKDLVRHPFK